MPSDMIPSIISMNLLASHLDSNDIEENDERNEGDLVEDCDPLTKRRRSNVGENLINNSSSFDLLDDAGLIEKDDRNNGIIINSSIPMRLIGVDMMKKEERENETKNNQNNQFVDYYCGEEINLSTILSPSKSRKRKKKMVNLSSKLNQTSINDNNEGEKEEEQKEEEENQQDIGERRRNEMIKEGLICIPFQTCHRTHQSMGFSFFLFIFKINCY